LAKAKNKKQKIVLPPRARKLLRRALLIALSLQVVAFVVAGTVLVVMIDMDLTLEFYSAHRQIKSAQEILLPATAMAGAVGFFLVALVTWIGFRILTRQEAGPIQRADEMLRRLSRGDLSYTPAVLPDRERWALDDSAETMLAAFRERTNEVKQITKELHHSVLSLRYKATGSDPLTLNELRDVTGTLDRLSKKLVNAVKWFDT
jgi:methyl-accepting chemotaxis protein